MQSFGALLFFGSIALGIYGFFAASVGAIVLAVVLFGASIGAFAAGNANDNRARLERIEQNQQEA